MSKLRTRWFGQIDRANPLPEYPRPQLVRGEWQCLNGVFDYCITDLSAAAPSRYDGEIVVPFSIETELSGVEKPLLPTQALWYRKRFLLDKSFQNRRCILHFGAVDWQCTVFVNGREAGSHTGGYCPFSFDITGFLRDGENELTVRVYDPTDAGWQQRGKQVLKPGGLWYTATSGIWQTVWLEPVSREAYIEKLCLTPDYDGSKINIKTTLSAESADICLKATVYSGDTKIFYDNIHINADILIPDFTPWSPENPFLYALTLEVYRGGELCDTVKSYFGMRKYSISRDKNGVPRLFLNNEPYFQRGLLDQGYFCEGGLTPPCDEAMIYDIESMKELGFNMLRKHIKVEPARWYYHCDRLGMIVWQDMVSGGAHIGNFLAGVLPILGIHVKDDKYKLFSREKGEWRENFRAELFGMMDALHNAVSIYCWVPFNEGWGQFDAREIAEQVKERDPSRIVDHASGWHDQKGPDLRSTHRYILPILTPKADGRPWVISEFGGYSQVIGGHAWDERRSFGYVMYRGRETLTRAYKRLIERQIMPKIGRRLSAFVYTQLTDVELEVNGILTYNREMIKIDPETVKSLNDKMKY
ncbi:MAG: glycoside hydrolase family 2 [Oscillospiraceae bacterium]|nr:glycoside hydrolase family 2 [Oscillospiraceae bacterium]